MNNNTNLNKDSIKLLQECSYGSKMGLNSINQVCEYVVDDTLMGVMNTYKKKHEDLETKIGKYLQENGQCEKEPGIMASVFSHLTADMKLMMKDDNHQIAKLMMDGCNMGIQSISKYVNEYNEASQEVQDLCEDLVKIEEDFMKDLKQFM